jgi:hypothetical protein
MITQNTSPVYVNRVYQDWMANGGVYGDGGVYYQSASNTPTLNFQFAGATAISSQITFTRASTGSFFNAAGTLTSAAINDPRFDYNPSTLAAQGLLIEEARTNSIRNNTMVGAVAGTPGTVPTNWFIALSSQIVGTGVESGITYADIRLFGTNTSGFTQFPAIYFETSSEIAAVPSQTWAESLYVRLAAGTGQSFDFGFHELDSGGAVLRSTVVSGGSSITPTAGALATSRRSGSATTGASTAFVRPVIAFTVLNNAAIDITLRIGLPQLELGAFATSVIPTTTTALTRAADVASVNTLSPWYNATEGTLYAEFSIPASTASRSQATLGDGTANERIIISNNTSLVGTSWRIVDGGVDQCDISNSTSFANGATVKVAGAYAVNNFATCQGGGAVGTDTSGTLPTVTTLFLGNNGAASYATFYLRRITYYPRRLSNAELQTLTT